MSDRQRGSILDISFNKNSPSSKYFTPTNQKYRRDGFDSAENLQFSEVINQYPGTPHKKNTVFNQQLQQLKDAQSPSHSNNDWKKTPIQISDTPSESNEEKIKFDSQLSKNSTNSEFTLKDFSNNSMHSEMGQHFNAHGIKYSTIENRNQSNFFTDNSSNGKTFLLSRLERDRSLSLFYLAEFFQYVSQNEDHIERMRHLVTGLEYFDVDILWKILTSTNQQKDQSEEFLTMSQFKERFKKSKEWSSFSDSLEIVHHFDVAVQSFFNEFCSPRSVFTKER